jgi:N-acetylglucosaminyldiphosphoundecaprenol N-acetyl-beta-D-mannosaminyltransferase
MYSELYRNVWCILGLPFDAVDMQSAIDIVHQSVKDRSSCFISTPNLNFLIASQKDIAFRDSVISSELSIADGMPLIWIAKFLGFPIIERVPGSGLIDKLNKDSSQAKVKVFFFGGIEGVAEKACNILNKEGGQLECAGTYYPGFGTIEDMSEDEVIDKINLCAADFVIVSLGAKKGQAWIMKNRHKIHAPVISHLGAVVNFIAGSVNRSPVWMQKSGMEWLWRVYQEPVLWKRYVFDGIAFIKLIISRVIPYKIFLITNRLYDNESTYSIDKLDKNRDIELILSGIFTNKNINSIRESFINAIEIDRNIIIRMNGVTYIDASVIGLIMVMRKLAHKNGCLLYLLPLPKRIKKIFTYNGALFLLDP